MTRPPAMEVEGLVVRHRRGLLGGRERRPAVDGVDLRVGAGETVALVGESGSGKTTLARAALALIAPERGRVRLLGRDPHAMGRRALRRFRRRVQMLFQDPDAHLNPGLRVGQILHESARLHRPDEPADRVVDELLERVGLADRRDARPRELSGGERRRVGIARVLAARPELLVADEPTSGLDAALKADIMELLLARNGGATLVISHDLPMVAATCGRIAVMLAGRIVEELPRAALGRAPHHPYTRELLAAAGLGPEPPPRRGAAAGRGEPGCTWVGACPEEAAACREERPSLRALGPGHRVACHAVEGGAP